VPRAASRQCPLSGIKLGRVGYAGRRDRELRDFQRPIERELQAGGEKLYSVASVGMVRLRDS
jgi:hypothetical protein